MSNRWIRWLFGGSDDYSVDQMTIRWIRWLIDGSDDSSVAQMTNGKLSASANSQAERFFEIHETFFEIFETFFEEVESFFETFEDYLNHLMFIITIKLLWIQMVSRMMTWYILLTSYSFSRVFYWRNFSFYLLYIIIYNK